MTVFPKLDLPSSLRHFIFLGQEVHFKAGEDSERFLLIGWSYLEKEFCWTEGMRAAMRVCFCLAPSRRLQLRALVGPYLGHGRINKQKVHVYENDVLLTTWKLTREAWHTVELPDREDAQDAFELVFIINEPVSPAACTKSKDMRRLGFYLKTMVIDDVPDDTAVLPETERTQRDPMDAAAAAYATTALSLDRLQAQQQDMKRLLGHELSEPKGREHPRRYQQIFELIDKHKCKQILEIGTYNGINSRRMIETAALHWPLDQIRYYGFDLFELMDDEIYEKELSKKPPTRAEVMKLLTPYGKCVRLYMGFTRDTLPKFSEKLQKNIHIDFIFVDGGHAIETIRSDWAAIQPLITGQTIVLFDDYYVDAPPELDNLGCNQLIHELEVDPMWKVIFLPIVDVFTKEWGVLKVRMAQVIKCNS